MSSERGLRAARSGQRNQVSFGVAIEFARVDVVWLLPFDSTETLTTKAFPRALDGGTATVQRVSDFRIGPTLVGFQQDACSGKFLSIVVAS